MVQFLLYSCCTLHHFLLFFLLQECVSLASFSGMKVLASFCFISFSFSLYGDQDRGCLLTGFTFSFVLLNFVQFLLLLGSFVSSLVVGGGGIGDGGGAIVVVGS